MTKTQRLFVVFIGAIVLINAVFSIKFGDGFGKFLKLVAFEIFGVFALWEIAGWVKRGK